MTPENTVGCGGGAAEEAADREKPPDAVETTDGAVGRVDAAPVGSGELRHMRIGGTKGGVEGRSRSRGARRLFHFGNTLLVATPIVDQVRKCIVVRQPHCCWQPHEAKEGEGHTKVW